MQSSSIVDIAGWQPSSRLARSFRIATVRRRGCEAEAMAKAEGAHDRTGELKAKLIDT